MSSPGAVAGRALALGTLLSVGTFSFIIGGLAAAYDVRTASEAVTAARRAAQREWAVAACQLRHMGRLPSTLSPNAAK